MLLTFLVARVRHQIEAFWSFLYATEAGITAAAGTEKFFSPGFSQPRCTLLFVQEENKIQKKRKDNKDEKNFKWYQCSWTNNQGFWLFSPKYIHLLVNVQKNFLVRGFVFYIIM